jgi:hypothetical protein
LKGETRDDDEASKYKDQEDTSPEIIVLWLRNLELLVERTLLVAIVALGGHIAVAILRRTLLVRLLLVWLLGRRLILLLLVSCRRRLRLVLLLITAVIRLLLLTPVVISVGFAHDGGDSMELSMGN